MGERQREIVQGRTCMDKFEVETDAREALFFIALLLHLAKRWRYPA